MSMRLRGASVADLEELGIDTTGMSQGKKSIVQQFKHMAGIDIMEGTDYKSTYRILDELHEKWATLNDAERAAITEAVGGKRGGSVMSSLMTNWEDAQKVVQMANNSTGSAMQEQAHYAESVQFSIDRLRASWQELAYNLLDSKALKGATEFLVNLLNALNEVTKATDGLIPVLAGLGAVGYTLMSLNGFVKTLGGLFKTLQTTTEAKTEATVADTIANSQNAASELADAAAKDKTSQASAKLTGQQIAETNAQRADTVENGKQALSEAAKNYKAASGTTLQYFGERPETPTLVREPKSLVSGKLGGALTTLGFDTTSAASMAAAGAIAAFVAALAAVGVTAYATYQHNEKLKESAYELANAYNTSKDEIDGYKEQISDLYNIINDSSTSYEDARAAREQLLGVQNTLIEKYGTEAENVKLVTDAVNGQVEALDKLNEKSWQQTVNDFNKTQGTGFLDFWNHLWHGANDNVGVMQDEMFNARVRIHATAIDDKEFLQQIEEAIGGEYEVDMNAGSLILSGDLNDVKDKLYQIQNAAEKIGVTDNFMQGLTKQINEVEDTLTKYQDMADQWTFNEDIMPNYSEQFQQMQNGYKKYQDAIVSGNALAINEAKDGFADIFDGIGDAVAKDKNKDRILSYFRNMYPDLKSEIGSWQLGRDLADTTVDTLSVGFSDALSKFHSLEELKAAQTSADQEMQSSYMTVEALANQYGLTVDGLIAKLKELGQVPLNFRVNQTAVDRYQDAMYRNMGTYRSSEADKLDNIINQSQYKDQINTFGDAYWDAIAIAIKEAQDANDGLELSEEKLKETVEKTTEAYIEQANAANALQNIEPFSGKAFAEAKDELGNLTELYKKFVEQAEKDPAKIRLDISDVEKLREKWESVLGSDYFNQFEQTLTSPLSDEAEIMQAFNQAATEYVKKQIDMSGATEETGEMVKAELTQMGLLQSDVNAFVDSAVRAAQIEREVTAAKASGNEVTARLVELYAAEGASLGYTNEELVNYVVEMGQANGLEITGDLSWLDELCNKLGISIGWLNSFKAALNGATASGKAFDPRVKDYIPGGAPSNVFRSDVNKTNARVAQQIRLDRAADAFKVDTGKGGGGGGGKSDAEKETDVLAELSKQLDEIQSAYSSLSEIVKEYNENGKLTVDQAQALINTDFKYLAMLTDQNGQLQLNEEGFRNLTMAKIQEMQVQLALNAIDAVNNLQTEADAVNFLTYAYEGLAGKTLEAAEAQLQFAVAAAKARGAAQGTDKIGEAADKIYAGFQATKKAIGNVDLSSGSLAGKKDEKSKDDKDKKDTEKKQEDTKTKFNWLDRLVNKIQRSIDQLSKRAEKYFSYMEKNALVDRQLAANRRMIVTQQFAVDYYQNKAGKALKKVPKKYRNLLSGDFDPTSVKKIIAEVGSGNTKKFEEYLNWQELVEKAQDALADAYDQERDLINSKLENVLTYFDDLLDYQQSIIDNLDATNELLTAQGKFQNIDTFIKSLGKQRDKYTTVEERNVAYDEVAKQASKELADSYRDQVKDVEKSYEANTAYNKLAKKKRLNGWEAEALKFIQDNNIQAEDVDDVLKQYKVYYKNRNKSGKQKNKAEEAEKKLQEAAKRAADSLDDLTNEQQEQQNLIDQNARKQKEQNEQEGKQVEIDYWNNLRNLFDLMTQELDAQIRMISTITEKYTTIYDLLDSVDLADIKKYNVDDVFGIDLYGEHTKAITLQKAIESLQDSIDAYHEKFDFYGELIKVLQGTPVQIEAGIQRMLSDYNLSSEAKEYVNQISKDLAENGFDNLNSWLLDTNDNYEATRKQIAESITTSENLSKKLLDAITDQTDKLIEALTSVQQAYASRGALINDEWTVDKNGITEYGYAKIGNFNKEADAARRLALYYNKQIADLQADTTVDKESTEYKVKLNDYIKKYYDAVKSVHSTNDEIYNIAKKAMQNEVDNISKLVDNYKKALNAKKAYYDYDKSIKEKNKNIQALKAEAAALENVADQASKARLKQLQAEFEEAQADLDDTVFNHQIQVETDALDKLVTDLTEALNDVGETIEESFEKWSKTVKDVTSVALGYDVDSIFKKIIDFDMNGAINEETLAKEIADAEAAKQKQIEDQNKIKSDATTKIKQLNIAAAESKYNTTMGHASDALRRAKDVYITKDKVAKAYADQIIAERKAEADKAKAEGRSISSLAVLGAGTSEYDWKELYSEKLQSFEKAYKTAVANYNATKAAADAELNAVKEKAKPYQDIIDAANKEIEKLKNSVTVSTQTPTTMAPTTTGSVSSSVATDIQEGKYASLQSIGDDMSVMTKDVSGINTNVLEVLNNIMNLDQFNINTEKPYITTMQKQMSSLTTNVSTIATNTTNISSQLTHIYSSVQNIANSSKVSNQYGSYNVWNDGTYWYNGMKRMGKIVTYR